MPARIFRATTVKEMMIKMNSPAKMYPMIIPARASPLPPRFGFLAIFALAICPQMIPGMNPSGPISKLVTDRASDAIAKPLVFGGAGGSAAGGGGGGGGGGTETRRAPAVGAECACAGGGTHLSCSTRRLVVVFGFGTVKPDLQVGHRISVPA